MKYALQWPMRSRGNTYLTTESGEGSQREQWSESIEDAILYDSVQEATNGLQRRALAFNDTNHKVRIVPVEFSSPQVGEAL